MDKNNFSEIYKKYVMTAYSAAMQVVHNEADADDIAQETMVKLYLNIDALDEDRVEGWVRVAAKNLGIDYQRKTQRFDWNELDEDLRAEEMELPTLAEEEKQGLDGNDPEVFASVLTESVQKSLEKNSYGKAVTVKVSVEKDNSGKYGLSDTEMSKLEAAMFPTE